MPKQDLSEFAALGTPGGQRCWFGRLTPDQQAKVLEAREQGFSLTVIGTVVAGWLDIKPLARSTVANHWALSHRCCGE